MSSLANKKVTILGASLGGLIAAAELRSRGIRVRILEKSKTIGGLYAKVETPFGVQELGMHVVYLSKDQIEHVSNIFGRDSFEILSGVEVDLGASWNFGQLNLNSHYPNLLNHPKRDLILNQILALATASNSDARSAANQSFGAIAAEEIVCPILKKLWQLDASELTDKALNCFFDLRRLVVCAKEEADKLKADPRLDQVIANPIQTQPKGQIFGGRSGIYFKNHIGGLDQSALEWARRVGIEIEFGQQIEWKENHLEISGEPIQKSSHACIFALPLHALLGATDQLDKIDLSIYYIQLEKEITPHLPVYYILCHDSSLSSSRIVHYDGYRKKPSADSPAVISIEVLHKNGQFPKEDDIAKELSTLVPQAIVKNTYRFPKSLPLPQPSLNNKMVLDEFEGKIRESFGESPVYFTGMRTDQGVFFSHHTIGAAYESALDCIEQLI
jgi:hypothetical protein